MREKPGSVLGSGGIMLETGARAHSPKKNQITKLRLTIVSLFVFSNGCSRRHIRRRSHRHIRHSLLHNVGKGMDMDADVDDSIQDSMGSRGKDAVLAADNGRSQASIVCHHIPVDPSDHRYIEKEFAPAYE